MSMEYKLPLTAKEVEQVLVKGKEVLPNIEEYKGLEEIGTFVWNDYVYLTECLDDNGGNTGYYYIEPHLVDDTLISLLKQASFARVHYRGEYADFNGVITIGTVYHSGYYGVSHTDYGRFACFGLTVLTQPNSNDWGTDDDFIVCSKEFAQIMIIGSSQAEFTLTFYK